MSNTPMTVDGPRASVMLRAVRARKTVLEALGMDDASEYAEILRAEWMLEAALRRIRENEHRIARKRVKAVGAR